MGFLEASPFWEYVVACEAADLDFLRKVLSDEIARREFAQAETLRREAWQVFGEPLCGYPS